METHLLFEQVMVPPVIFISAGLSCEKDSDGLLKITLPRISPPDIWTFASASRNK